MSNIYLKRACPNCPPCGATGSGGVFPPLPGWNFQSDFVTARAGLFPKGGFPSYADRTLQNPNAYTREDLDITDSQTGELLYHHAVKFWNNKWFTPQFLELYQKVPGQFSTNAIYNPTGQNVTFTTETPPHPDAVLSETEFSLSLGGVLRSGRLSEPYAVGDWETDVNSIMALVDLLANPGSVVFYPRPYGFA